MSPEEKEQKIESLEQEIQVLRPKIAELERRWDHVTFAMSRNAQRLWNTGKFTDNSRESELSTSRPVP